MVGVDAAVTQAARLDEINFPEFTAKLITDTFDAIVGANIRQTEAYLELIQTVASTLTEYINNTVDDISGTQILEFFIANAEDASDGTGTLVREGATLDEPQAAALNKALTITDEDGNEQNQVAGTGKIDAEALKALKEAAAKRIAANKYTILKEMVKQGVLRLVVEQGLIETRLTFSTYGSSFLSRNASAYNREKFGLRAAASTGGLLSPWASAAVSTKYTNMSVKTSKESQRDIAGSSVQIFGTVQLRFKTDYLPLN